MNKPCDGGTKNGKGRPMAMPQQRIARGEEPFYQVDLVQGPVDILNDKIEVTDEKTITRDRMAVGQGSQSLPEGGHGRLTGEKAIIK